VSGRAGVAVAIIWDLQIELSESFAVLKDSH